MDTVRQMRRSCLEYSRHCRLTFRYFFSESSEEVSARVLLLGSVFHLYAELIENFG